MDVSIAVSLIRGQMGTVVERAVNTAVETVLAEMLKVVGVKFEELKAQVVLMKRDIVTLQREKALKEKENDNIRAKLRYTELKLKYYRQGVEEELQQRASTSALVHVHPSTFTRMQKGEASNSLTEPSPSCSAQRTTDSAFMRSNQVPECPSSEVTCRRAVRVRCPSDSSDLLTITPAVSPPVGSMDSTEGFFCQTEHDAAQRKAEHQETEWTIPVQSDPDDSDAAQTLPPVRAPPVDAGQQSVSISPSPHVSMTADGFMLHTSALKVKQEVQSQQEEEEEVICIKEEPEEEQEVMSTLLLDCQMEQGCPLGSEAQSSMTEQSGPAANLRNPNSTFSPVGQSIYALQPLAGLFPSAVVMPSGVQARQAVRPWTKDLSLYEEYKLRRNELRRRNMNRRRELEKTLPQPLLADLVRERREKTRLRVARWRAKRKLQACLNQTQIHGGPAGLSHLGFPANSQHQQPRAPCASTCSSQQRENSAVTQSNSFLSNLSVNSISPILPLLPSSSSLLLSGPNMAPHEATVTSSSSSSYPQVSQSPRSISLTDVQISQ